MTREELLKYLRPLEWRKLTGSLRAIYKADQFIDGEAFISEVYPKWTTSFDNVEYNTLAEAKQAAEEYRKNKILSHFNLEEQ
nr:MAG TPA: Pterin 4 alpha carbinolamine dehydratase [Caudoviricetes sp.]